MHDLPTLLLWGVPEWRGATPWAFHNERRFQLLAVLAVAAGQWVERDRLGALLWPERDAGDARRNLRKVLHDTHTLPGLDGLDVQPHALRWVVLTDLAAFAAQRAADAAAALAWRRAPPLQGIDDARNGAWTEWLNAERLRLEQAWLATALAHAAAAATPEARAAAAQQVLAVDALDEAALLLLLQAELALGRPAQARTAYRRYAERLAQELGVEPSRTLRDWLQRLEAPALADPARALAPALPADVPPLPTAAGFIGRRQELSELRGLLERDECRLLTLLGPGGAGKSSVARQALEALRSRGDARFSGGLLWLPLHAAADANEVPGRWAQALGLVLPESADPLTALLRLWPPAGQRALLVLDNVEHLHGEGGAGLVPLLQQALAAAPGLTVLCTSRRRLALAAEWVLPLAGLALPDEDSRDLEAAASFDAVRLFERCASAAQRGFTLAPHLCAVLDIVNAVGGLPLAIELAASWVRLLPPAQIAADLAQGIDVLQRDPGGPAPARPEHDSLRAVLDGSWQLLGPHERQALASLSVFEGGFTRAAAQAVAGCSLPLLSALVDRSLLAVDDGGRFALHPVVQAYAAERLVATPAPEAEPDAPAGAARLTLRDRHAAHFARQMVDLAPLVRGAPARLVAAVAMEFANLRGAWRHALARGQAALLLDMLGPWRGYFEHSGRTDEGLREFRAALALPETDSQVAQLLARLRHVIGALLFRRGEPAEALAMTQAGAVSAERAGERVALKGCLNTQGLVLWQLGRAAEALAPLARAKALALEDGDRYGVAVALGNLAVVEKALGRFEAALAANHEALPIVRELGDADLLCSRLHNIGNLHRALGQWPEACQLFDETLRHCQAHGLQRVMPFPRLNRALVDIELGAWDAAALALQAVLDGQAQMPQALLALAAEMGLARIDFHHGRHDQGRQRLQRVVQMARAKAFKTHPMQALIVWGESLRAQGRSDEAAAIWCLAAEDPVLDMADRLVAQRHLAALQLDDEACARLRQHAPTEAALLAALCDTP